MSMAYELNGRQYVLTAGGDMDGLSIRDPNIYVPECLTSDGIQSE
jgi:hypothetical protein